MNNIVIEIKEIVLSCTQVARKNSVINQRLKKFSYWRATVPPSIGKITPLQ